MTAPRQQPYLNTREDSAVRFLGIPTLMRSTGETTNGAFGLMEQWMMPPGFASPYHKHHREDEAFYVLEGKIAFVCDGKWLTAGPGTYVFGPREIPHGFKVVGSAPARMLLLCAPAGFEHFVLELSVPIVDLTPPDMAKLMVAATRYEIDILGPLPEQIAEGGIGSAPATDNKSVNLRWIQAFNERDWQTESAYRGPDFRAHMSGAKEPLNNQVWAGFMSVFTTAFPDAQISVDACVTERDTVVSRWTLTGTHRGEFQGVPPTGRTVTMAGIEFNRVADGKIAEHWAQFDLMALMQQIGAFESRP
jgi:steroid delta-isomerase-like uncharacterized protein